MRALQQARPLFPTDFVPAVTGPRPTARQKRIRAALETAEESMRPALRSAILADLTD